MRESGRWEGLEGTWPNGREGGRKDKKACRELALERGKEEEGKKKGKKRNA